MKMLSMDGLALLAEQAKSSPRRRANLNLHPSLDDPIQRLAIAMEPDTYVRPHRHPQTWELLYPLRGRFLVLYFDEVGQVTDRTILGEDCAVIENPAGQWHAVLSLDTGGVIFEVKHGPYQVALPENSAPWSPADGDPRTGALLAWYATARPGQRWDD